MFRIPLTRPAIGSAEHRAVAEVLDSGMLSEGRWTRDLEEHVHRFVGTRHAIAVASCTTGIEIALRALGIGPGHEVLVPDYTHPATASAVVQGGARPVLVDVHPDTMLIDLEKAERALTHRTRAILPVSLFDNPLDAPRMIDFCSAHQLEFLENAACSLGAEQYGRRVGSFARASVFSLHPRMTITSDEGGIITTDDDELASWIRCYKNFGMSAGSTPNSGGGRGTAGRAEFVMVGTNAKLSNLLAALAVEQMKRLDDLVAQRRMLARRYQALLQGVAGVRFPTTTQGGLHARQSFIVFVSERDRVLNQMREMGIEAQIGSYSLHREPAFRDATTCQTGASYPGSLRAFERSLALPLFHGMTLSEQDMVVRGLDRALQPPRSMSHQHTRPTCAA